MSTSAHQKRVGLLDTLIILMAAFTIVLIVLWMAGQILGEKQFEHLPEWLSGLSSHVWKFFTTTAITAVLALIRRRIGSQSPNYLLWILLTVACLLIATIGVAIVFPRAIGVIANPPFTLEFNLEHRTDRGVTSKRTEPPARVLDLGSSQRFVQLRPTVRDSLNIALQENGRYKVYIDLPDRCAQFLAHVYRVQQESKHLDHPTSRPTEISFTRSSTDPRGQRDIKVLMDCQEGGNCSKREDDPGWVSDGSDCSAKTQIGPWLPGSIVYAEANSSQDKTEAGWKVPSLETLKNTPEREKIGYTEFLIDSGPLPELEGADSFTYLIRVNGSPIYIDGSLPEDMIQPLDQRKGVSLRFGLENLDFSGADNGCEKIEVLFGFRQQDGNIKPTKFSAKYAALRDAGPEDIKTENGITFQWTARYLKPKREDKFELFVHSTPNVKEAARVKAQIDNARMRFQDMEIVGIIRPPLNKLQYGIVVGLHQPSGQIKFTFDWGSANRLYRWFTEARKRSSIRYGLIKEPFLYEMKPEDNGVGRYRSCSHAKPGL